MNATATQKLEKPTLAQVAEWMVKAINKLEVASSGIQFNDGQTASEIEEQNFQRQRVREQLSGEQAKAKSDITAAIIPLLRHAVRIRHRMPKLNQLVSSIEAGLDGFGLYFEAVCEVKELVRIVEASSEPAAA